MAINFPSSPALNDIYTLGTRQWKWNGNGWALQPLTAGFTGSIGYTGSKGDIGYTGSKGDTGLGFNIAKTYTSVANLTADTSPSGINTGEFAIIENGSLTDAENSRLYLWNGSAYSFVSDLSGTIGFTGSFGYTGSKGDQGVIGYTGSKGFTGSQGDIGYTGSKGDIGYTGSLGFTGSKGDIGYTGSKGDIGYTGSEGNLDITTSSTPPTSGVGEGDIWVDSATGVQYFYYNDGNSTQWVELSNQGVVGFTGSQGAQVDTVDSSNFSSAVTLLIKNSSGTTLKTIIGNAT
jgi:collagen type VII alpha